MTRIFLPYRMGRGISSQQSEVQETYDDLKDLVNTSGIDNDNIAVDAGLPEKWISWATTGGHDHRDGTIGPSVVNDASLDTYGPDGVQWVVTQTTGVKLIVGVTPSFKMAMADDREEDLGRLITVLFGQGSDNPTSFNPGTLPTVHVQLYDPSATISGTASGRDVDSLYHFSLFLEDVTSQFFTMRYMSSLVQGDESFATSATWRAFYMAQGIAPGFLSNPAGI